MEVGARKTAGLKMGLSMANTSWRKRLARIQFNARNGMSAIRMEQSSSPSAKSFQVDLYAPWNWPDNLANLASIFREVGRIADRPRS